MKQQFVCHIQTTCSPGCIMPPEFHIFLRHLRCWLCFVIYADIKIVVKEAYGKSLNLLSDLRLQKDVFYWKLFLCKNNKSHSGGLGCFGRAHLHLNITEATRGRVNPLSSWLWSDTEFLSTYLEMFTSRDKTEACLILTTSGFTFVIICVFLQMQRQWLGSSCSA